MKLSTRSRYGTRLMIELATRFGKGPIFLKEIAKNQDISEKYLSQLVIPLKAKGLISSYRGAHGGYILSKPPAEITLKDIVEPLEGDLSLIDCIANSSICGKASDCVSRDVWERLGDKIIEFLSSITLEELMRMRRKKIDEVYTYTI